MKAYCVSIKDDDDAGAEIVFATTAREARKKAWGSDFTSFAESYIYVVAHRDKRYDDLEKLSEAELACKQWRDGWQWFDRENPDTETASDAEFIKWYESNF